MDYKAIKSLELEYVCTGITIKRWDYLMKNAVKANGYKIRKLIKKHLPNLYESLALKYPNPYEHQSKRTDKHLIYIHSGIEYFIKFQD